MNEPKNLATPASVPVSIVIFTANDAASIARTLDSCKFSDDIHLLDASSTANTRETPANSIPNLLVRSPVAVYRHSSWIIDHLRTKHPWVFFMFDNEQLSPALSKEIHDVVGPRGSRGISAGFAVGGRAVMLGRILHYASRYYPPQVRLFHRDRCRAAIAGIRPVSHKYRFGELKSPLLHEDFSRGLKEWFLRINRESGKVAELGLEISSQPQPRLLKMLMSEDHNFRREQLKKMSFFYRGRSLGRFLQMYFGRFGWLDGSPGFHYCAMIAMYEYFTEMKMRERKVDWIGRTSNLAERLAKEPM